MTPHLRDFLLLLPVYALALARLTRLATEDRIFDRPRTAVQNWLAMHRHPMLLTLSDCPWCLSVWLAAPAVAAAWWWTYQAAPVVIAAGLGLSHVVGLLHNYSSAHAGLARQSGLVAEKLEAELDERQREREHAAARDRREQEAREAQLRDPRMWYRPGMPVLPPDKPTEVPKVAFPEGGWRAPTEAPYVGGQQQPPKVAFPEPRDHVSPPPPTR